MYSPFSLLTVSWVRLVSLFTIVTVAAGIDDPEASWTTPTMLP